VTPAGVMESRRLPGSGAGPSPDRMMIGSEGIMGVITEAWMRIQDRPTFKGSIPVLFKGFYQAAETVRALSQSWLFPSNCRLIDAEEASGAAGGEHAMLVLGFESADHPVDAWMDRALGV
jgi:alkyldihydroxyacetonephosphate synthase